MLPVDWFKISRALLRGAVEEEKKEGETVDDVYTRYVQDVHFHSRINRLVYHQMSKLEEILLHEEE